MANRYFINGGVNNNWSTIGNWSTTSGGAGGSAVPTSTDDVFLDANSPNCVADTVVNKNCLNFDCTGYTNTFTLNQAITIAGNIVFSATMTTGGTATMTWSSAAGRNATTNGKVISFPFALSSNGTYTLNDDFFSSALITLPSGTYVLNGFKMSTSGSLTSTGAITGTTILEMTGTGTLTYSGAGAKPSLTINSSGTVTFSGAGISINSGTFTYTAGTIVQGSAALVANGSCSINAPTIKWNNLSLPTTATVTVTLLSALSLASLTLGNNPVTGTFAGSYSWTTDNLYLHGSATGSRNTLILKAGNTYTVTTAILSLGSGGIIRTPNLNIIKSDTPGTQTILTYQGTSASCEAVKTDFTDIDASGGNPIQTFKGTVSNSPNCYSVPATIAVGN